MEPVACQCSTVWNCSDRNRTEWSLHCLSADVFDIFSKQTQNGKCALGWRKRARVNPNCPHMQICNSWVSRAHRGAYLCHVFGNPSSNIWMLCIQISLWRLTQDFRDSTFMPTGADYLSSLGGVECFLLYSLMSAKLPWNWSWNSTKNIYYVLPVMETSKKKKEEEETSSPHQRKQLSLLELLFTTQCSIFSTSVVKKSTTVNEMWCFFRSKW